jgi:hypothetical protein
MKVHVVGMEEHMTWLKKLNLPKHGRSRTRKIGDLKLASQIREICISVADSADAVSVLYYGPSTETKAPSRSVRTAKKRAERR